MNSLEPIEHDYVRSLMPQSYKQMSVSPEGESVGLGIRGYESSGFYSHWG